LLITTNKIIYANMSSPHCIKVKYGSDERTIALYSGLGTDELVNVIKATFNVFDSTVVGFLTEVNIVSPTVV